MFGSKAATPSPSGDIYSTGQSRQWPQTTSDCVKLPNQPDSVIGFLGLGSMSDTAQVTSNEESPEILTALRNLARGDKANLSSVLIPVEVDTTVEGTRVQGHCHYVALDSHGRPRLADLVARVTEFALAFAIPRSKIKSALEKASDTGDTTALIRLHNESRRLFTRLLKSGEGGELLLFAFAETHLGLPQIVCKMDLKSNSEMHIHGSDGLHCGPGKDNIGLALYWCESKIYSDFARAVRECLSDLAKYLLTDDTHEGRTSRDLQILDRHLDLADTELEEALMSFFDPTHRDYNRLEMRGICLVGFDYDAYPKMRSEMTPRDLEDAIREALPEWKSRLRNRVNEEDIADFFVHFLCLPLPSAQDFRLLMREKLGLSHVDN